MLIFLSLLEWKPLLKMKIVVNLSLDIKVWDTIFYLPKESDVGASWVFSVATLEFMRGGSIVSLEGSWTGAWLMNRLLVEVTSYSLGNSWLRTQWINGLDYPRGVLLLKELDIAWGTQS